MCEKTKVFMSKNALPVVAAGSLTALLKKSFSTVGPDGLGRKLLSGLAHGRHSLEVPGSTPGLPT